MKTQLIVVLSLALSTQGCLAQQWNEPAKFSVLVRDEQSKRPLEGALVEAGFEKSIGHEPAEGYKTVTPTNGLATFQGTSSGLVDFGVSRKGYYRHVNPPLALTRGTLRWEPWNATNEVLLKPILKPADLQQKEFVSMVPELGRPCGFDLLAGDWTPPHGKGVRADMFVTTTLELRTNEEITMTWSVQFPHPLDGLVPFQASLATGSELRWNHLAPESGYLTNKTWLFEHRGNDPWNPKGRINQASEEHHYYIRFRTVTDDAGKILSCHYGVLWKDVQGSPALRKPAPDIRFRWYWNPVANDRNIESLPWQIRER